MHSVVVPLLRSLILSTPPVPPPSPVCLYNKRDLHDVTRHLAIKYVSSTKLLPFDELVFVTLPTGAVQCQSS